MPGDPNAKLARLLLNDMPEGYLRGYPERIGSYRVQGILGRGGMGAVYRAEPLAGGAPVAIKVLKGASSGEASRRRFAREVRALQQLEHPNVVALREAGEHDGEPYVVLDLLECGSLEDALGTGGPFAPRAAARLGAQLADAIAAAHALGITHRDLKPDNVLVDALGKPYLTDFGLAKRFDTQVSLTQSGALLGTPGYLAPEQAEGNKGGTGPATDVWGVGAILYALLSGRPPHVGETLVEVIVATGTKPPPPLSRLREGIPPELCAIVERALRLEPHERWPSAAALRDALQAWLRGEHGRAPRWGRRVAIATVALGACVLGGWALVEPTPAPPAGPLDDREAQVEELLATIEAMEGEFDIEEVERGVSRVLELEPQNGRALSILGNVQVARGRAEEALKTLELAARYGGPPFAIHQSRALALARLGRLREGLIEAEAAVRSAPEAPAGYNARGLLRSALGQPAAARVDFEQAIRLVPTDPVAHFNLGQALRQLEDYGAAVISFERALELRPDYAQARVGLRQARGMLEVEVLLEGDDTQGACERLLALARDFPDEPELWISLGVLGALAKRSWEEQIAWAERAVAADPARPEARFIRGYLYVNRFEPGGKVHQQGVEDLEFARRHCPPGGYPQVGVLGWAFPHTPLSASHRAAGRLEQAREVLVEFIELDPPGQEERVAQARDYKAQLETELARKRAGEERK